jgi:hypothetical protein
MDNDRHCPERMRLYTKEGVALKTGHIEDFADALYEFR